MDDLSTCRHPRPEFSPTLDTLVCPDCGEIVGSRRNKYGNRRVSEDGYSFDSEAELRRYRELRLMQAAGEIHDLAVHPSWPLVVNGIAIGRYTSDFAYAGPDGPVVEDVKPAEKRARSRDYVLRKRLMLATQGIEIVEVEA